MTTIEQESKRLRADVEAIGQRIERMERLFGLELKLIDQTQSSEAIRSRLELKISKTTEY